MINLTCKENKLNISISANETINYSAAKKLIRKARRMIQQNKLTFVIIDLDSNSRIHKGVLEFIDRVLYNNNFPVLINR
ncbi:MAG: hypothetical protein COB15_04460 [Flavobacteriales bacterium]|nr:MAG: hypothetical protein COB15_04460 [Flavobacteriales bacterium]